MKTPLRAAFAALLLALPAAAAELTLAPSSRLWLEGDSTLHPFSSTATVLSVSFLYDAAGPAPDALAAKAPIRMTVRVPVAGLKSAHGGLDKNLRRTLRADEHPDIVFELGSYAVEGGSVTAAGTLTVAGKSLAAALEARYEARGGGLLVEGAQPLRMSDFGIKPPSMMLGAVKTADEVVVKYRLVLVTSAGDLMDTK